LRSWVRADSAQARAPRLGKSSARGREGAFGLAVGWLFGCAATATGSVDGAAVPIMMPATIATTPPMAPTASRRRGQGLPGCGGQTWAHHLSMGASQSRTGRGRPFQRLAAHPPQQE
jgi:hypothetical protein